MITQLDCLIGLRDIASDSIDCVVTSPPYNKMGLKHSGKTSVVVGNQIWNKFRIDYSLHSDNLPEEQYHQWMIDVLDELYRVVKPNGSIFFNHKPRRHNNQAHLPTDFIGKSKAKLYQLIIWNRKNSPNIRGDILVPSTEHIYWLCKEKPRVFRNALPSEYHSEVWNIIAQKQQQHPAPFPEQLAQNCVLLSTQPNDVVLDPFMGSGTTAVVAQQLGRQYVGFEIDPAYIEIARQRLESRPTLL